jgi:hypothetical protein
MNKIGNLIATVGDEKTLLIVCGEYASSRPVEVNDSIFIYFLPENVLHQHDYDQKGRIQHLIESKQCTQVIFLGTLERNLIESFEQDAVYNELRSILKFNLSIFLRDQSEAILSSPLRDQLLTEQHVIAQCSLLMDFYFIKDRVNNRQLTVIGLISDKADQFKRIFCNGIIYNDIISMN